MNADDQLQQAMTAINHLAELFKMQEAKLTAHSAAMQFMVAHDPELQEALRTKGEELEALFIASRVPDDLLEVMRQELKYISG